MQGCPGNCKQMIVPKRNNPGAFILALHFSLRRNAGRTANLGLLFLFSTYTVYESFDKYGAISLFYHLSKRAGRKTTIFTTNLGFDC